MWDVWSARGPAPHHHAVLQPGDFAGTGGDDGRAAGGMRSAEDGSGETSDEEDRRLDHAPPARTHHSHWIDGPGNQRRHPCGGHKPLRPGVQGSSGSDPEDVPLCGPDVSF